MKKITLIVLVIIGLSSCKKNLLEKVTPTTHNQKVTNFNELSASDNFDWKTSKKINFTFKGVNTISPAKGNLKISSDDDKIVFYSGNHLMSENFTQALQIPAHIKGLKVSFGTILKAFDTQSNNIVFDCLPTEITE
jgi:hypothetical protein